MKPTACADHGHLIRAFSCKVRLSMVDGGLKNVYQITEEVTEGAAITLSAANFSLP